jgi:WXG100 family type VII secretion target
MLAMQTEVTASAAQFLRDQCEGLGRELGAIARCWDELSAKWTGIAGSAYEPAWGDWHRDAQTVTAILAEHSELLLKSVALLVENERQSAAMLGSVL